MNNQFVHSANKYQIKMAEEATINLQNNASLVISHILYGVIM